jgi:hypothetical protein
LLCSAWEADPLSKNKQLPAHVAGSMAATLSKCDHQPESLYAYQKQMSDALSGRH